MNKPAVGTVVKVEKSGNDWVLTLKSGRKFSDGTDVTATAVMTALQRTNQANNAAQTELGTMTFEVQNALTLKIMSTIATPASAYSLWVIHPCLLTRPPPPRGGRPGRGRPPVRPCPDPFRA